MIEEPTANIDDLVAWLTDASQNFIAGEQTARAYRQIAALLVELKQARAMTGDSVEEAALEAYCGVIDDGLPHRVNFPSTVEDWEKRAVTAVVKACGNYWHVKTVMPLREEVSSLLKERGELREAIKPFAEGQTTVQYGKVAPWVTYEELHRARSALQGNGDDK